MYLRSYKGSRYYFRDEAEDIYIKSVHTGGYEMLPGVDVASFEILTNFYSCDKTKLFYEATVLKENYTSYHDYERYGYLEVDHCLYWFGKRVQKNFRGTLNVIAHHFFTDRTFLFVNGKKFSFHKDSFVVLNKFYAKDETTVYHSAKRISGADSSTFEVLREYSGLPVSVLSAYDFLNDNGYSSWARDKNQMYFCGDSFMKGIIDPASVCLLDLHVLKDKNRVYYFDQIVEGADAESFQPILRLGLEVEDTIGLFTSYYRDRKTFYYLLESEKRTHIVSLAKLTPWERRKVIKRMLEHSKDFCLSEDDIKMLKTSK